MADNLHILCNAPLQNMTLVRIGRSAGHIACGSRGLLPEIIDFKMEKENFQICPKILARRNFEGHLWAQ